MAWTTMAPAPTHPDIYTPYYSTAGQRVMAQRNAAATKTAGAQVSSVESLFDPQTGLPTRLPSSPKEAMLFQLQATRMARQMQQRQLAASLSSLRYGLGWTQRQSPYGLGYLMSPLLSQMAQTQANVQYDPGDYSYFVRGGSGARRSAMAGQGPFGLPMTWPRDPSQVAQPGLGGQPAAGALPGAAGAIPGAAGGLAGQGQMFPEGAPDLGYGEQGTTAYDPAGEEWSAYRGGV